MFMQEMFTRVVRMNGKQPNISARIAYAVTENEIGGSSKEHDETFLQGMSFSLIALLLV